MIEIIYYFPAAPHEGERVWRLTNRHEADLAIAALVAAGAEVTVYDYTE